MTVLCALGRYHYGNPNLGIGTEFAAFTAGFKALGHQVEFFDPDVPERYPDYSALNRALLDTVYKIKPDILFTVQRDYEFWAETLNLIRTAQNVKTVTWCTDDSFKYGSVSKFIARNYDLICTTCPQLIQQYKADGISNVHLSQWAANPDRLLYPKTAQNCKYDVTFVGAAHGTRSRTVEKLRSLGIKVQCFGIGWDEGPVSSDAITEIMNESFVSLNFPNAFKGPPQIKMRTFEIPGSGGLMLSQRVQGLGDYYREGEEMLTFGQIEEAKEWITRLRANPGLRDQICIAGYRRTMQEHTFANRFAKAIEALKLTKKCPSDEHERTFDEIAADYKVGKTIRMTRTILESGGQLIFGQRRGTRAARRAAFEASLLLFGKRTYTAAGLPGRLFPHP